MRTLFTIISLCLLVSVGCYAQLNKGSLLLGGSLSASATNSNLSISNDHSSSSQTSFSVSPSVGVFLTDR